MLERIIAFGLVFFAACPAVAQSLDSGIVGEPWIPAEYTKYIPVLIIGIIVYFVFFHKKKR